MTGTTAVDGWQVPEVTQHRVFTLRHKIRKNRGTTACRIYIYISILFYAAMNTYQISGKSTKPSRSALSKDHHTATHLPVSDQVTATIQVFYQATRIMLLGPYIISAIGNVNRQSYACTSKEPAPQRPHFHLVMKAFKID